VIAALVDGWLVVLGRLEVVLVRDGLYARLWRLQFAEGLDDDRGRTRSPEPVATGGRQRP
jgi:hypothetical protein